MDETFLTTAEVLEYLQVNLRTVYRLLKAGKIPAVRVGRQWRFRRADLDAWLERQGSQPAAPRGLRSSEDSEPAVSLQAGSLPSPSSTAASTPASDDALVLAAARAARGPDAEASPRVLVVDDEESIRELLAKTLALVEYDVTTLPDAGKALDHLRRRSCDLLITDLRMPGMDGLSLIREARRLHPTLPVVIITGFSSEASAIEAINLGVNGYLTKPFRVPKVLSVAAKALGQ